MMRVGNLKELRKRCNLFQLLSDKNSHHVMTLSKPEATQACNTLNLLEGSRLEMIERIGHALLNPSSAIDNGLVLFMDKEDSNSDDNLNVI